MRDDDERREETTQPPERPDYEKPQIVAYDGERLITELGPAQACTPFSGAIIGC